MLEISALRIYETTVLIILVSRWSSIDDITVRSAINFQLRQVLIWDCFFLSDRNLVSMFIILMWLLFLLFVRNRKIRNFWRRHHRLCFLLFKQILSILVLVFFVLANHLADMAKNVIHILLLSIRALRILSIMLYRWGLIYPWGHLFIALPVLCLRLSCWHSQISCSRMNLLICHLLLIREFIRVRLIYLGRFVLRI
jgi:hypothetical protein